MPAPVLHTECTRNGALFAGLQTSVQESNRTRTLIPSAELMEQESFKYGVEYVRRTSKTTSFESGGGREKEPTYFVDGWLWAKKQLLNGPLHITTLNVAECSLVPLVVWRAVKYVVVNVKVNKALQQRKIQHGNRRRQKRGVRIVSVSERKWRQFNKRKS